MGGRCEAAEVTLGRPRRSRGFGQVAEATSPSRLDEVVQLGQDERGYLLVGLHLLLDSSSEAGAGETD